MAAQNHNLFHHIFTAAFTLLKGLVVSIAWILIGAAGFLILQTRRTPWDILLGLPLLLIGGGFVANNLGSVFLSFFSPTYNRGICVLCKKERFKNHGRIKEILGLNQ